MPAYLAGQDAIRVGEAMARVMLQIEMKRRGISYRELAEALKNAGVNENEANVRTKIGRGKFTAAFMMLCLQAMSVERLDLRLDEDYLDRIKAGAAK